VPFRLRENMLLRHLNIGSTRTRHWLTVLCFLASTSLVHAIEAQPSYQVFTLKPGARTSAQVNLFNNEQVDLTITPGTKEWFVAPVNKKIPLSDWLKVDQKPFVLKPGERKTVKFTAQAPKKAVGEVMGMLTFSSKPVTDSMIDFRLSLAVYVALAGAEKRSGDVAAIAINTSSETIVSYLFVNRGNVHLRPQGVIRIYDDKDQQVLNVSCPPSLPTYPGTKQAYSQKIRNYVLPFGRYRAEIIFKDADWGTDYPLQKKKFKFEANGKIIEDDQP